MDGINAEAEEFLVAEAVGLALEGFDFVVEAFARTGGGGAALPDRLARSFGNDRCDGSVSSPRVTPRGHSGRAHRCGPTRGPWF